MLGIGPFPYEDEVDPDLINAGKQTISELPQSSYFDSAQSFAMIRGGHIDLAVLGGMAIVYPTGELDPKALAQLFKDAVGADGANVILDPVGGAYAEAALRAIGWQGRFLVVGFPAGIPKLPLNLTLLKSCDVCGVFWGAFAARDPKRNAAHVEQLFRWWAERKIAPKISATYPLERGGEAIAALRDRKAIGKLVVTLD